MTHIGFKHQRESKQNSDKCNDVSCECLSTARTSQLLLFCIYLGEWGQHLYCYVRYLGDRGQYINCYYLYSGDKIQYLDCYVKLLGEWGQY